MTKKNMQLVNAFCPKRLSWFKSQKFIAKLNKECLITGYKFSLPTEAQWKYACRAGTTGDGVPENIEDKWSWLNDFFDDDTENNPYEVKIKKANAWGLHDMQGNIIEWCLDWYGEYKVETFPSIDPLGPDTGKHRVLRGGAGRNFDSECRSACRNHGNPYHGNPLYFTAMQGFRLALVPVDEL